MENKKYMKHCNQFWSWICNCRMVSNILADVCSSSSCSFFLWSMYKHYTCVFWFIYSLLSFMLIITASWAISVYFAYQRTWKPFNPILGETYELANHGGISFIAEQVSFQYVNLWHSSMLDIPHHSFTLFETKFSWLCISAFGRNINFSYFLI